MRTTQAVSADANTPQIEHIYCRGMTVRYVHDDTKPPVSNHISFEVAKGEILAIMGPSGAGKSTLLRGLLGRAPHITGEIRINGEDVSASGGLARMSHRVGLVPQTDVLVDELSMVENIRYFHRIAVDTPYSDQELDERIAKSLESLGLRDDLNEKNPDLRLTRKRIGDGSGTKNRISGGQAKRANIAMELVNDPDVLIIDEPTSGLSSHDSLELLQQLRGIADSGKIVMVIIHQPSSDIFKLIDRLLILDGCGNCVRSGSRDDVCNWIAEQKTTAAHCKFGCDACGNYFPENVLAAIEAKRNPTNGKPDWTTEAEAFSAAFPDFALTEDQSMQRVAGKSKLRPWQAWLDLLALFQRHALVKSRDKMSMAVTFLAPPFLGWLFATVFRASPEGMDYAFANNTLFPQLLFMLIVCTMFLGLVNSAVEVIKDRPILEREAGRGLRMWAYYGTKFLTLMGFGIVQVGLLAGVALGVTGGQHLFLVNFAVLLLVMAVSLAIGLLLSSWCDTPTKAFNLVPLILLPQIVLGGALLPYKDMGAGLYLWETRDVAKQPIVAKWMPASWAYQLAMRSNFDVERGMAGKEINTSLASLRHIKPGGFLSTAPDRRLIAKPLESLGVSEPGVWTFLRGKSYGVDTLVLALIAMGSLVVGWVAVGGRYRSGSTLGYIVLMMVSGVVLFGYQRGTVPISHADSANEGQIPWGYIVSPTSMSWVEAFKYCKTRGASVANFETTLTVLKSNRTTLGKNVFWVLEVPSGKKAFSTSELQRPSGFDARFVSDLSDDQLVPFSVIALTKAYTASPSAKEPRWFVCN
ncbi:ABC transporter ATP-binding/permease protein [Curvibacter sp. AEP1-3]|uniref:ATP-binding cassette domain-containing protein n=1 Tax=Curvibacter sp. AEP1-3 TaxID=1844971 RepID=UPI000B3C4F27|nr:ATP-binding cassette domain-containing protein [Curvibacter sp. AEP1-3]ARV17606.1 ABC transporter ATP-binding/permease protein [Curvibacter sp. AEP1-3]